MKVGYFKVTPSTPELVSPRDRTLSLPFEKRVVTNPRDKWKLITVPLTGLVLAVMFIGSLNFGANLSNYDLPKERLSSVASIDLPDNVIFLASVYESISGFINAIISWLKDIWQFLMVVWRDFWGLTDPATAVIDNSRASAPSSIFGGKVLPDKKVYAVTATPADGMISVDETLKQNLSQTFADPVDIKFDSTGRSGEITPVFSNGQRGSKYLFVLTPAR